MFNSAAKVHMYFVAGPVREDSVHPFYFWKLQEFADVESEAEVTSSHQTINKNAQSEVLQSDWTKKYDWAIFDYFDGSFAK